ncbi:MAG: hypothetical protein HY308_07800 [Gammaproteobacteria bacterium]|nr:hypothetical protein [Gammaproteobacteria bacterium]
MEDLVTVLRIIAKHKGKLLTLGLVVGVVLFLYGGDNLKYAGCSPDDTYRLEYYDARRYQRLLNSEMEAPSFARLYRNFDNKYFGESNVSDFFGGNADTIWNMANTGNVMVGQGILFENIPPVTQDGVVLPIPGTASSKPTVEGSVGLTQ